MQKKLTLVSELDNILNNSLVCLVHENHVKEENPVYEFGYLTGSIDYIREETKEPNLMVSSTRTVYDIMENKLIEKPAYQGFYGEIFHIASVGSPRYFEYFSGLLSNDYTVDFDLPLFHISGKEVELESVEDINDDIVFTVRMRDGFAGTINVNNKGLDLNYLPNDDFALHY